MSGSSRPFIALGKRVIKSLIVNTFLLIPGALREKMTDKFIIILLYHEITPEAFSSHVDYITRNYNVLSLRGLAEAIESKQLGAVESHSLIVTFDDGWKSNYKLLSVIKQSGLPVTIFLTAGLVNTNRKIWNYTIDRVGSEQDLNTRLKKTPNKEKNRFLYEKNGYYPEKEYPERDFLSLDEIDQMKPYIDFQSHGMFHPVYPMCDNEELEEEMTQSRAYLEKLTGEECYAIAYPYGRYGSREVKMAEAAGYRVARIANNPGLNTKHTNRYELQAIGVPPGMSVSQLKNRIVWEEVLTILRTLRYKILGSD